MAEIMLWTAERIELTCGYNEGFYTNRTDIVSSTIKDLVLLYRGNTSETRLLLGSPHIHLYWLNIESFQGNSTNGKWKVKVPGAGAFFSVGVWSMENSFQLKLQCSLQMCKSWMTMKSTLTTKFKSSVVISALKSIPKRSYLISSF